MMDLSVESLDKVETLLKINDVNEVKLYWKFGSDLSASGGICAEDASSLNFSSLGLSFYFWIQVEQSSLVEHGRHLIYRLKTGNSSFFETFIAKDGTLIVAIMTEKLYTTSLLVEKSLNDGKWHSVLVVHAAARSLMSSSQLRIYLDGEEQHVTLMRFPKTGTARELHIGAIGDPSTQTFETLAGRNEGLRAFQGFGLSQTASTYFSLPVGLRSFDPRGSSVRSVAAGLEDYVWGPVRHFPGKMAAFAFFREPLSLFQCKRLHGAGPTFFRIFSSPEPSSLDIASRCRYAISAYACSGYSILELSSKTVLTGKTGMTLMKHERVQDVLFPVGGLMSLIPILESLLKRKVAIVPDLLSDAQMGAPSSKNEIARFFEILCLLFFHHENYRKDAIDLKFFEALSVCLNQIRPELLDKRFLEAIQLLNQSLRLHKSLEQCVILTIICNFKLWKRGHFNVRLTHLEYLTSLVRQDRRFFRHHFGTQQFLDNLRQHFSGGSDAESVTLRNSVLRIVRHFLERDAHFAEVSALLHYIPAQKSAHLVCEVIDTLFAALESPKCNDQLYLLLFEPKCAELLYGILPEYGDDVMKSLLKVINVLLRSHRVYSEDKKRLYLQHCGFGGLFSTLPCLDWSESSTERLADILLSIECPESNYAGFLALCAKLTAAPIAVKLGVAKKMLDHLVSTPGAAKWFASQVDWAGCILRLLIKQGCGEIIPAKCRTPSTLSFSTPSTPLLPATPLRSPWRTIGSFVGTLVDTAVDAAAQIGVPIKEGRLPGDECQSLEGSFDASFECVDDVAVDDMMSLESNQECLSPSSVSVDEPLHDSSAPEFFEELVKEGSQPASDGSSIEEHLLLVTTSIGVILSRGLEGTEPWKEAWKVLSSIDILTEANIFYCDPNRIKTQVIAVFAQSAVRWLREDQASPRALQVLKWLYSATELGANHEGSLVVLELGLQIMDMYKLCSEDFDVRKMPGMTEVLHVCLGLMVFYSSSTILEVCSLACAKLHQFLNCRGASIDNQMASFILYEAGAGCTAALNSQQENVYSFILPILKTLLQLSGAETFLPMIGESGLDLGPSFYDEFKILVKSRNWDRYLNEVVKQSHERFHTIYLSSLELQLRQLSADCNEDAAISWHLHCRQVGESRLKFMTEIINPLRAEREKETKRFQRSCFRKRHLLSQALKRWHEKKEKLAIPDALFDHKKLQWTQTPNESFCRNRQKMAVNKAFEDHSEASRLRDETGPTPKAIPEEAPFQIPKKDNTGDTDSLDSEEDFEADELKLEGTSDESPSVNQIKVFKPVECEKITIFGSIGGVFQVSEAVLLFTASKQEALEIPVWMIREVYSRRYCLQRSAIEIFLVDNTNFFFNFQGKIANQVYIQIRSLRPPNLISRFAFDAIRRNQLIQQWQRREISNFEYLMALNTASGRTFNDLAQYPVMPWILSDYSSSELNFEDYGVFRDFSKPVGAQSPKNREEVKRKYETFEDPTGLAPKFHYGSHYSSPAVVTHYLVRMEPFTSLHIDLQGGRFDIADRQFVSIPAAWRSLMESSSDVKELIPEFFTTPSIFVNNNRFDLGRLQGSELPVNDVLLPSWAHSPEDFILKHREALECDYVSRNLHAWINLIFGHRQKGPQAVDALNVFYYSSYEDAVNLDSITDVKEQMAISEMIRHFGQTPVQLFRFPHPSRLPLEEIQSIYARNTTVRRPSIAEFPYSRCSYVESFSESPLPFIWMGFADRGRPLLSPPQSNDPYNLFCFSTKHLSFVHRILGGTKTTFEREELSAKLESGRVLPFCFHPSLTPSADLFALTPDGKYLFIAGCWDSSLHIFSVAKGRELHLEFTLQGHLDVTTCVAIDRIGLYCVTGSADNTCIVWSISEITGLQPSRDTIPKLVHVLIGHKAPVVAVAVSTELDTVVSASSDGTILLHSAKTGMYHSSIYPLECQKQNVEILALGEEGDISAVYRNKALEYSLYTFSCNGKILASRVLSHRPTALIAGKRYLLLGDITGSLEMLNTWNFNRVRRFAFPEAVLSMAASPAWTYVVVSLKDGSVVVIEPDLTVRKNPAVINI